MKAMLLKGPGQPFALETVPDPEPGPGEAVARVYACGSGLTIQHVRAGRTPVDYPRIIGHEFAGEIVALGAGVTDLAIGTPVSNSNSVRVVLPQDRADYPGALLIGL